MKKRILLTVCILMTVSWMTVIFLYSAQHAQQSSQNSAGIVERIIQWAYPDYQELSPAEQLKVSNTVTFVVRKGAHMTEYAILAILFYTAGSVFKLFSKTWTKLLIPFSVTVLYAATDEFHQLFVPGRSGEVRDVLIDALGAMFGILIAYAITKWTGRKKKSSEE